MAEDPLDEELRLEEELAIERARGSLLGFIKHVTPRYQIAWHHRAIATLLDDIAEGRRRRVIVNCPPRHGKTYLVSTHFPAYLLGRNPHHQIIACSYGAQLAQRVCRDVQRVMDQDAYIRAFPASHLFDRNIRTVAQGSWMRNADMFEVVNHRGMYRCAGVGGSITGAGADTLLLDDALRNAEDASSETILAKQWEWWSTTFRTRLHKDGAIVIIMTRWSQGDIVGRLLDQARAEPKADQWDVVNFPAINEDGPNEMDPRQEGEPLWPEMFPLKELDKIRAGSTRAWRSLYQGRPTPPGGTIIQDQWWRRYAPSELPQRFDRLIVSADLTFSDSKRGDWNVFQVWGRAAGHAWLLDQVRAKLAFVRQCEVMERLYDRWPAVREVVIEKAANGAALVDAMRVRIPGIIAVPVGTNSKQARLEAVSHLIEAGQVHIPRDEDCRWAMELVDEHSAFPHARHDDMVDALTLGLSRLFPPRSTHLDALPVSLRKPSIWLNQRG